MKPLRILILAVALLACSMVPAQTPASLPADKITRVETAISSFMSQQNIPGLSIAIVHENQIRFQRGYGMAEVENFVPAKALTVYRIASVSKPLTAVAAMQLVEAGKLDLDAPVQKYAPSFPTKNFPITTRQVLAHLSGIRDRKSTRLNSSHTVISYAV